MSIYQFPSKTLYRILLHVLFWVFSFFVINYVFAFSDQLTKVDYLFTGLFHLSILVGVYINLEVLIPLLFHKKRYLLFFSLFTVVLTITSILNHFTFSWLANIILPNYYFVAYFDELELVIIVFIYMLVTSLLKLSKSWFLLQELNTKLSQVEKEKIASQLTSLKAQLNPHFLFNSLNVLHSLALKQSGKSPEAIIHLADILRYAIYQSENSKVNLSQEVEMIENYLSLQKYRVDETTKISFSAEIETSAEVVPLLFLPLIENSFKHGVKADLTSTYVDILLRSNQSVIYFEIENNKGDIIEEANKGEGGVGIANIKKRLELLYHGRHEFKIEETASYFKVTLIIRHEN